MKKLLLPIIAVVVFVSCSKDRNFPYPPYKSPGSVNVGTRQLIHYYNFNDAFALTLPSYTIGGTDWLYTATGIADAVTDPTTLNARNGDAAGTALRLRNPANNIVFSFPTSGYKNVLFSFAAKRSNSGAQLQTISYTIDGANYITDNLQSNMILVDTSWNTYSYDFSGIAAVNDNPFFKIKIDFGVGNTGVSGNDRFDNITVDADSIPGGGIGPIKLLHYWNFNNSDTTKALSLINGAAFNFDFATSGTTSGYFDFTTSTASQNMRNGDVAGNCLRVRNPVNAFIIKTPTTGYKNIVLSYAAERTSSGAQNSSLYYSTDGGATFTQLGLTNANYSPTIDPTYTLYTYNLANIAAANNNANLQFKIVFSNGNLGTSGNNRFDNITIDGYKQ